MEFLSEKNIDTQAESVIKSLSKNKFGAMELTYSQIRNVNEFITSLYNKVQYVSANENLTDNLIGDVGYTRAKLAYATRDKGVKDFLDKSKLMDYLNYVKENPTVNNLKMVCRYVESCVAFHKFYGDN